MIAVAAGAALALVAVAAGTLLRRRHRDPPIATPEEAAAAAERALAGFIAADVVVGSDGRAALAIGTDGRVAAIRRRGRRIAVDEVRWTSVRATGGGMIVETGTGRAGELIVAGVDALDMRRLAAAGGRVAV